ncbi:hypothetical protein [Chryseobacterium binzhouense]|uniref:hypothetical protein n=1 Tax=Chryseobacterium binzhouense TaxID=2593646 RepID=UPI00289C3528|nr:hypothetical protein [Chryseobacterium binzhouense]
MENKYRKLADIEFSEINIGLEETEFIKEYSKLTFNGFFFIKTIESNYDEFRNYLNSIHKPLEDFDINIRFQSSTIDAKDFIYHLINNESLKNISINFNAEGDFLKIAPKYSLLEEFKKLSIAELNKLKFHRYLFYIVKQGSIYEEWGLSDRLTSKIINDFIENLFQNSNYRIFEIEDWSGYDMGFYVCFLLIDLDKAQITFFAKDDYD